MAVGRPAGGDSKTFQSTAADEALVGLPLPTSVVPNRRCVIPFLPRIQGGGFIRTLVSCPLGMPS